MFYPFIPGGICLKDDVGRNRFNKSDLSHLCFMYLFPPPTPPALISFISKRCGGGILVISKLKSGLTQYLVTTCICHIHLIEQAQQISCKSTVGKG